MEIPKSLKFDYSLEINGKMLGSFTSIKAADSVNYVEGPREVTFTRQLQPDVLTDGSMEVTGSTLEEWVAEVDWQEPEKTPPVSLLCSAGSEEAFSAMWLQSRRWGLDSDEPIPVQWLERVLALLVRLGFRVSFNSYASSEVGWSSDASVQNIDMKYSSTFSEDK